MSQPVWSNGDFETDPIGTTPPTGWTLTSNTNPNITDTRPNPQTLASLNLATGGALLTAVVGGAAESQTDPDLLAQGTLRFPKYGQRATRVNATGAGSGTGRNVNTLKQTMTVSLGDVDPVDNKVHVRFAVAPILENPGHSYVQQPYYFVRLQNLTKGQTVYQDFNASGQPGVPWKNFTDASGQSAQYTDWQLVDVSPGDSLLAVGDQVELMVIAAGCAAGGHWGRVYVDAVGSGVPGLYAWATGPQLVNAGSTITYSLNYKNGGTTTTSGTKLDFVTPPNTTFQSVSLGAACTTPAVGSAGTVTCPVGTLANGSTGALQVTVNVPAATANGTVILNGNYSIYATGISALIGPKVFTTVTSSVSYANLGITKSDGVAAIGWGQPTSYVIDVTNQGPVAAAVATVRDVMPAQLTGVTWTCTASGGGSCTASGSGSINDTAAALPVGAQLRYVVTATIVAGSGNGQVINTATVTAGGSVSDPDTTDNTAVDTDAIGTLRTLSVSKTGDTSGGRITSVPSSISCDLGCASASGQFLDGSQVVLTASPVAGATFGGWGGACAGTSTSCTVTLTGDQSVTASFIGAPATIAITGGDQQTATINTAFAAALQVQVTDAAGQPVAGATVSFAAPGSGASAMLGAATAVTNAAGLASVSATANGSAGSYQVSAAVAGVSPAAFALQNLGVPASVTVSAGSGQSATVATAFGDQLVALVRDAANQPLAGVTVTFGNPASGASATLSAATAITDASGLARVSATANTVAGGYAVTAAVAGVATPATFALSNQPGAATTLTLLGATGRTATVTTSLGALAAQVTDAFGNPVPGVTVTFTVPGTGATATLSAASATTDGSGQVTVTATAGTIAGAFAITVAAPGAAPRSFTITTTADVPASLAIVSGDDQQVTVAAPFAPLQVLVRDAHGNPVPGQTVTFTAPATGATALVSATAVTDGAGLAGTAASAGTVAGSYLVSAATAGVAPVSFTLQNLAGAAATIQVASGSPQSATVATAFAAPLRARVLDDYGNPVPSAQVTFTSPGAGASATLGAATATSDGGGYAEVSATANTVAGGYAVTAAVAGVATPATFALSNQPGAVTTLTLLGATARTATVTTSLGALAAQVTDAFGNPVPGVTVTFTVPGTGATATLSAASATTDGSGQVTVTATAGTIAGAFAITVAAPGAAPRSFTITTTADVPASLAIVSGDDQQVTVAAPFAPLQVLVRDAHGNPVPDVDVQYLAPATGATAMVEASRTTDAAGLAASAATAGTVAGAYAVTASLGALLPVAFTLRNTAGAAATLQLLAGDDQRAAVTAAFAAPLRAQVLDAHANLVPDVDVSFAAPSSGASAALSAATVRSDGGGQVEVTATANTVAGGYLVTLAVVGGSATAQAALTNTAGAPASITAVGGGAQTAIIETAFAAPLALQVHDAYANPVPDAAVTFTAPASAATALLAISATTTDEDGRAQTDAVASSTAGDYQVTATVAGVAEPASFALRNSAGIAETLEVIGGAEQAAVVATAFAQPLVVRARDHAGNPVPGATVRMLAPASSPSAQLAAETVLTDGDGVAAVTATADLRAGSYQVTAELGATAVVSFGLQNLPGAPARLALGSTSSPQATTVRTDFVEPLLVRVEDAFGNPTPGVTVAFAAPSAGASAALSASSAVTGSDGACAVLATASAQTGTYLVAATVDGVVDAAVFALRNLAGAPATLVAEAGAAQRAEVDTDFAEPLQVRVLDAEGNAVPDAVIDFTAAPGAVTATLSASSVQSGDDGTAAVSAHASTAAGSHTVTAIVVGAAAPVAFELTNTPGAPATVTVDAAASPQQAEVNTAYPHELLVTVTDRFGNPVPDVTVAYVAPATGPTGALATAQATSDEHGQAAVALLAGTEAGAFVVTATVDGVAAAAQFELTNRAGPAHTLAVFAGDHQRATVDAPFDAPLTARVTDAFGNPVLGEVVQFHASPDGATASLSVATATSDAQGLAATEARASTVAGAYEIVATAAQGAAPVTFSLRNDAGAPASLVAAAAASPQSAEVLHSFVVPLAVTVRDGFGNPVPDALVTFTVGAAPGATLSAAQVVSDGDGGAQIVAIADATAGSYRVQADVAGVGAAAHFELTNTASTPARVVIVSGDGQQAMATAAFAQPLVFRVLDGLHNPVPGAELTVAMPGQGATASLTTRLIRSDNAGEVALHLQAGAALGAFTVSATAPGASNPAIANLAVTAIPTTVVAAAAATVAVDQPLTVAVEVTGQLGTPAGELELLVDQGAALVTVALVDGRASFTLPLARRGAHQVVVRYPAQGSFAGSEAATLTVTVTEDSGTLSGAGGCAAGGGGSLGLALTLLALASFRARRRARLAVALPLASALLLASAAPSWAQADTTRSINRFHAAAADSRWFALDSVSFGGELDVALALTWDYAHRPLVVYDADGRTRTVVVNHSFVAHTGASLTLHDRFRLSTSVPMAVYQDGDDGSFNGEALAGPKFAFGDIQLAGDVRVLGRRGAALRAAVGVRVTLPTGSRTHYMSDSEFAAEPRALLAGSLGALEYAGDLSLALRRETTFAGHSFGSELRYAASVGARLLDRRLLVGPELTGAVAVGGGADTGHPTEVGLGAHYSVGAELQLGVGVTAGVVNAVGTPDQRGFVSLAWTPTAAAARPDRSAATRTARR